MKIAYITNTPFPSSRAFGTQIAHMCQAFKEVGSDVTLVTNNRQTNITLQPEGFLGFKPSFKVVKVRFGLLFIPYSKIFFILNNFFFSLFILRKITISDFDVIYVRDEWLGFFLFFITSKNKLVYESHEAKYNFPARFLLKRGIKCVCISEGIYNEYIKKGITATQMIVAHDGIDQSFFDNLISKDEVRDRLALPKDKKIAMYIGGFDEWKGVDTFFEASELLKEVAFVAIGGSDEQIEAYTKMYPNVIFLGHLPYKNLKDNQQAADVLVIPNTAKNKLSSEYTSPLKLFAHMTSKIPLVISNIPSLTSVLSEKTATLFTSDNEVSLSEAITNSFQSEFSQAKANRAYTESLNYTWLKRAQAILPFLT